MKKFAHILKKYLTENNISFSAASKMCGVDRTLLSRYANGSRKPKNVDNVIKIVKGLNMSEDYAEMLVWAYENDTNKEENKKINGLIEDIIEEKYIAENNKIEKIRNKYFEEIKGVYPSEISRLNSKEEVKNAIYYVLKDAVYAMIKFESDHFANDDKIKCILAQATDISHKEQIINICTDEMQNNEELFEILYRMLPFLYVKEGYRIYYKRKRKTYRDKVSENCVITDKGVVLFDDEIENGFFSDKKEICTYYEKMFSCIKAKCRIFALSEKAVNNVTEIEEIHLKNNANDVSVCIKETAIIGSLQDYLNEI